MIVRVTTILLSLCLTMAGAKVAAQEKRPKLVVLELTGERGVDAPLVRLLDGMLLTETSRNRALEVIGGSDVAAMLSLESERQLLGCQETACLVEIGGALGGDLLLVPTIGRIGDYYILNLKLLDIRRSTVVSRASARVDGNENALVDAIVPAIGQLFDNAESLSQIESGSPVLEATISTGPSRTATWIALGSAVLFGAGGSAALLSAKSKKEIRRDEYAAYLNASSALDRKARYGEVEDAVSRRNRMVYAGWSLFGLATVAAGFATYDLITTEPEITAGVAVSASVGGALLMLRGEF